MEKTNNKTKLRHILIYIGLGTLTISGLYYLYKFLNKPTKIDYINEYITLNLQDIKIQIEEANGTFDENLKKKIFLKVNQAHQRVMKMQFDNFIEKNSNSFKNNKIEDELLQEFLKINWETYKSTTDYILTKIGLNENEYVELFQNMSLSDYMEYEYMMEKDNIFEGKQIMSKIETKEAFLEYQKISESYINSLKSVVNLDNKNSKFDEELQIGVLYSNIKIETQVYLKFKFTPKELLYMVKRYNLLDDHDVKEAHDAMMKNSPNFHKV